MEQKIMGKRSNFKRRPQDAYATPEEAVFPLLPFLHPVTWYYEPCCGNGDLITHLKHYGHSCVGYSDRERDAMVEQYSMLENWMFITNPPWSRPTLHGVIENLRKQAPTWLLFDADWMHTKQAIPYLSYCKTIVSVGRVKWIPGSASVGKDNCCWYLFDKSETPTTFIGR